VAFAEIKYKGRVLRPRRATISPNFASETVLVADPWDYVDLWLRREAHGNARAYWQQAREFAGAAASLPATSSPLPAYYCLLNAAKALLSVRKHVVGAQHGVAGTANPGRSLESETVTFKSGGVLAGLCSILGEASGGTTYTLKTALYHLPFVHRAFCLTFTSAPELFFPVREPRFVRKTGSKEAWFCAQLEARYDTEHTVAKLPAGWQRDNGPQGTGIIRKKARFQWDGKHPNAPSNQSKLIGYHQNVRKDVHYIFGPSRLWYVKRGAVGSSWVTHSPMTLTFAIMHRLSELSRYEPLELRNHFDRRYNWLLSEFIGVAPRQFVDQVASEITGCDFMIPGIRR
jgi:hypothetical protein